MKIMTCFIDTSAWIAIICDSEKNHDRAAEYFQELLQKNVKIITNNIVLDETVDYLKSNSGRETAEKFSNIIDESVLTINLRMDWISRRMRKNAMTGYIKSFAKNLVLRHFYISESIKKKKVDIIFSFDPVWKSHSIPMVPGE